MHSQNDHVIWPNMGRSICRMGNLWSQTFEPSLVIDTDDKVHQTKDLFLFVTMDKKKKIKTELIFTVSCYYMLIVNCLLHYYQVYLQAEFC